MSQIIRHYLALGDCPNLGTPGKPCGGHNSIRCTSRSDIAALRCGNCLKSFKPDTIERFGLTLIEIVVNPDDVRLVRPLASNLPQVTLIERVLWAVLVEEYQLHVGPTVIGNLSEDAGFSFESTRRDDQLGLRRWPEGSYPDHQATEVLLCFQLLLESLFVVDTVISDYVISAATITLLSDSPADRIKAYALLDHIITTVHGEPDFTQAVFTRLEANHPGTLDLLAQSRQPRVATSFLQR